MTEKAGRNGTAYAVEVFACGDDVVLITFDESQRMRDKSKLKCSPVHDAEQLLTNVMGSPHASRLDKILIAPGI